MPTDQQLTDLFTYMLDLAATQNVILRALKHRMGMNLDGIAEEIRNETLKLYSIREVSELRSTRDLSLLSPFVWTLP